MLVRSGDLIPVRQDAIYIPWTKRKSLMLNFLHRGPVTFDTYVYDTNVGDVSPLSAYFNPERWSVRDLNERFGIQPQDNQPTQLPNSPTDLSDETGLANPRVSLVPKLLIYPLRETEEEEEKAKMERLEQNKIDNKPDFCFPPPTLPPFTIGLSNQVMLPSLSLSQAFQSLAFEQARLATHQQNHHQPLTFNTPLNFVSLCHNYDDMAMLQAVFCTQAGEGCGKADPSEDIYGCFGDGILGEGGLPQSLQWVLQTINTSSVLETSA